MIDNEEIHSIITTVDTWKKIVDFCNSGVLVLKEKIDLKHILPLVSYSDYDKFLEMFKSSKHLFKLELNDEFCNSVKTKVHHILAHKCEKYLKTAVFNLDVDEDIIACFLKSNTFTITEDLIKYGVFNIERYDLLVNKFKINLLDRYKYDLIDHSQYIDPLRAETANLWKDLQPFIVNLYCPQETMNYYKYYLFYSKNCTHQGQLIQFVQKCKDEIVNSIIHSSKELRLCLNFLVYTDSLKNEKEISEMLRNYDGDISFDSTLKEILQERVSIRNMHLITLGVPCDFIDTDSLEDKNCKVYSDVCPICYLGEESGPMLLSDCGHVVHYECIKDTLFTNRNKKSVKCFVCRRALMKNECPFSFVESSVKSCTFELKNSSKWTIVGTKKEQESNFINDSSVDSGVISNSEDYGLEG
jgi:hypothetical protein